MQNFMSVYYPRVASLCSGTKMWMLIITPLVLIRLVSGCLQCCSAAVLHVSSQWLVSADICTPEIRIKNHGLIRIGGEISLFWITDVTQSSEPLDPSPPTSCFQLPSLHRCTSMQALCTLHTLLMVSAYNCIFRYCTAFSHTAALQHCSTPH